MREAGSSAGGIGGQPFCWSTVTCLKERSKSDSEEKVCSEKVRKFDCKGSLSARIAAGNVGRSKVLGPVMEKSSMESYYSSKGKPGCCVRECS